MSANDIDVDAFIHDIFIRPPIWDGSFGNKDLLWLQISANHSFMSVDALKRRWENLRRSFRRQLKKIPRNMNNLYLMDPHTMPSAWPYYQSMLFLVGRVRLGNQQQLLPVKIENGPTVPNPPNVDRKRSSADSLYESDQSSKKKRTEDAEISNIKRSHSSATLDGLDDGNNASPMKIANSASHSIFTIDGLDDCNNAAPLTKIASSATMNWGDNHDSHLIKDSDRYYLKSLLPYLDKLDAVRKLVVRSKIDEILRVEISKL